MKKVRIPYRYPASGRSGCAFRLASGVAALPWNQWQLSCGMGGWLPVESVADLEWNTQSAPRTWRTRKNPFENVWAEIKLRLELIPEMTAKDVIEWLMEKYPNQFAVGQIRRCRGGSPSGVKSRSVKNNDYVR